MMKKALKETYENLGVDSYLNRNSLILLYLLRVQHYCYII